MSVSALLLMCRRLAYPRMHLWLVFKHVQAGTQHLPGMSEDDQVLISPLHLARFHCFHQRLLIDYYDESVIVEGRPIITIPPEPLDVLTINTPSCILANSLSDRRCVVSFVKGQCKVMRRDRASNSSNETYVAPHSSIITSAQVG